MRDYPRQCWLDPRATVAPSSIEGHGLFARERIDADEVVIRLGGHVLTDEEFRQLQLVTYSSLAIDDHRNLLLADDSPVTFGNHSCDPSLWMADEVTLIAWRQINADDEVTVDYALHTADLPWSMLCHCGARLCRGTISNDDWKRPDLQARYARHFSPFLNRRIAELEGASK